MRTLILTNERTADDNINDIKYHFHDAEGNPLCNVMTGLFAFEGREPYLSTSRVGRRVYYRDRNEYSAPPLSEKLVTAVRRWCDTGKGTAIIHGRNVPNIRRASAERMPYKLNPTIFFYHLGSFGQNGLWSVVRQASDNRWKTNEHIYKAWRTRLVDDGSVSDWANMHQMDGGDTRRSWTTFLWDDGKIVRYDTENNMYDSSTVKHYKPVDYNGVAKIELEDECEIFTGNADSGWTRGD